MTVFLPPCQRHYPWWFRSFKARWFPHHIKSPQTSEAQDKGKGNVKRLVKKASYKYQLWLNDQLLAYYVCVCIYVYVWLWKPQLCFLSGSAHSDTRWRLQGWGRNTRIAPCYIFPDFDGSCEYDPNKLHHHISIFFLGIAAANSVCSFSNTCSISLMFPSGTPAMISQCPFFRDLDPSLLGPLFGTLTASPG